MLTPNLERIPQELKALPNWVTYRPNKTPVNPLTGKNARADDPSTWGKFGQAVEQWKSQKGNGIAGLGYEFSADDPFCGIDLDKCREPETGEIEAWAKAIIERLQSYAEVSPSGRGLHILVAGKLPPGGRRKGQIEMYDSGRYFTMTGDHLEGTPTTIENQQVELEALHGEIFGKLQADPPKTSSSGSTLELSDFAIIDKAKAARNGHKFERLWAGDITGYPSPSEATAALMDILCFWCGPDPERVDRLFRQSRLMRPKFDRSQCGSTWGEMEIQKALGRATEFYKGSRNESRRSKQEGTKTCQSTAIIGTISGPPEWPQGVVAGAAGNFSKTYSAYLETPESFLFMDYLTVLGHLISSRVTLRSEINPETRFYTVNLGESADTRKSTSINKAKGFFIETLEPGTINQVLGVGSAEGLAKAFKKTPRVLLVLDELNALVQKMRIDASVLSPCICTLFESNRFHSLTKKHEISIDDAELCMLDYANPKMTPLGCL